MERLTQTKFSKLLRFSNIAWILSYYDYIDQWKRVMTRLSKSARKHWTMHNNAFLHYGRSLKRDYYIKDKAASNIQMLVSDWQLFNKMLLRRNNSQLYLSDILMKLKPFQELILYQLADDTNYFVLHFSEEDESLLVLPSIKWSAHKSHPAVINQSQLPNLVNYVKDKLDLNAVAISRINKTWKMKAVLSPVIRVNKLNENELMLEESKFNKLYSKKWTWLVNTVICEYDEVYDANKFWGKFKVEDSVDRVLFKAQKSLELVDLDYCEPLHNLGLSHIEIRNQNCLNNHVIKDKESTLWVYLRPWQFTVKTSTGWYLVDSTSSKIVIAGDNNCKLQSKSSNWFLFKSHFIEGENYKVMLNFNDLEEGIEKTLKIFMTNEDDRYALVKISDIYKVELKEFYSTQYFAGFPCLTELELTIDECNLAKDSIMSRLNTIPRNLNLQINVSTYAEWIWYDSEFWDFINEFPSFKIHWLFMKDALTENNKSNAHDIFKRNFLISYKWETCLFKIWANY